MINLLLLTVFPALATATDMNAAGDVTLVGTDSAFVWLQDSERLVALPLPDGYVGGKAWALSDARDVVGECRDSLGHRVGVRWDWPSFDPEIEDEPLTDISPNGLYVAEQYYPGPWIFGVRDDGWAYGSGERNPTSNPASYGMLWRLDDPGDAVVFSQVHDYANGFVVTAVSSDGWTVFIEPYYRNGWFYVVQAGAAIGPIVGIVNGTDSDGYAWGADSLLHGIGQTWVHSESGLFTASRVPGASSILRRSATRVLLRRLADSRYATYDRFDANCDGLVNNFDIDGFVTSLLERTPMCNSFTARNVMIDDFVEAVLR